MSLKVALIGLFPFSEGGGPISRIRYLALGLRNAGAEVCILAFAPAKPEIVGPTNHGQGLWRGIPVYSLPPSSKTKPVEPESNFVSRFCKKVLFGRKEAAQMKFILSKVRELCQTRRIDVVLIHSQEFLFSLKLWSICRRVKVAFIQQYVELHISDDYAMGWLEPHFLREQFHFLFIPLLSSGNIVISSFLKEACENKSSKKALLIPTLSDPGELAPPSHTGTAGNEKPFNFTYVGTGARRDCLGLILNACAKLKESRHRFSVVFAGLTPQFLDYYTKMACELELTQEVEMFGWVTQDRLHDLYAQADAFLLLRTNDRSSRACFPGRLAEFLSYAKPVVLTSIGDFPRYFTDMENAILVPPEDFAMLAEQMGYLIAHPTRAAEIGAAGWKVAEKEFNYETRGEEIFNYLQECLGRSRGRALAGEKC